MTTYSEMRERLSRANQTHLLQFWGELESFEKTNFLKQLDSINFNECNRLFRDALLTSEEVFEKLDDRMKPIPLEQCGVEELSTDEELNVYNAIGLEAISKCHVGVLLLAGGQGTRLGVSYPKGMYCLELPSGKTLFQLQAERIKKIQELAEVEFNRPCIVRWYIMTSDSTYKQTAEFLKRHNYFGLQQHNIVQFEQGLLPCFDMRGRILLERKDSVSLAPDGNGGIYRALQKNGILDDMQQHGIKYLHVHSVDNVLVKVADPIFIGYCIEKKADCGAKVVRKASPTEALGVVCKVDDHFQVVEYSEITETTANLTDAKGNLVFNSGNICNHFFTSKFLKKITDCYETKLQLHIARKKIDFVNEFGKVEKPEKVNGIKIEKFIFDVFKFSKNFVAWEVPRFAEFSALKNSNEVKRDCPNTARMDFYRLQKYYIKKAGGLVLGDIAEISPSLTYAGEGLGDLVKGKVFHSPVLLT